MSSYMILSLVAAVGVLAVNYPPIPADLTTPVQQRLAINGPNSVSVGWNTYEKLNQSCVSYGTSNTSLTSRACSTNSRTYASSRTWGNSVTLTGLAPATTYYYKIVSTNSSVNHFFSPRTPGDTSPFNMNVVIDLGVYGPDGFTTNSKRDIPAIEPALNHSTIGALAQTVDDYEFIVHPGDLAYADDWFLKSQNLLDGKDAYQAILEQFYGDQLAPVSSRKPYQISPGNHEASCEELPYTSGLCPEGQHNFTDFMMRFGDTMPSAFASSSSNSTAQASAKNASSLALPPFWFSFEYGMAHIVMIDTETDYPNAVDGPDGSAHLDAGPFGYPGQQLDFLHADLASVDRSVTPWLIVAGHRPWYSTGGSNCTECKAAFEPIFYQYGVDLAIFGHVHNSQRFAPVYNATADPAKMNNPRFPMYIVAGGAGNIEGLSAVGSNYSTNQFAYADDFSYAQVKFIDAQHLGVDFIRSSTLEILDSSILHKAHSDNFVVQS